MRQIVSVLKADPDLAIDLEEGSRLCAERKSTARALEADRGDWSPSLAAPLESRALGLLVLGGMFLRRVELGGRVSTELLGRGDLIRPVDDEDPIAMIPSHTTWRVLEEARLAVLDERFQQAISAYPEVLSQLIGRVTKRAAAQSQRLAIIQQPRLTARLHLVLWQLADRFGRVERGGVALPIRLSHEVLAELIAAQRPSVSLAVAELRRHGLAERLPAGGWWLSGAPPDQSGSHAVGRAA